LTSCVDNGAGYLADADRFHTDTSGEEYLKRQEQYQRSAHTISLLVNFDHFNLG